MLRGDASILIRPLSSLFVIVPKVGIRRGGGQRTESESYGVMESWSHMELDEGPDEKSMPWPTVCRQRGITDICGKKHGSWRLQYVICRTEFCNFPPHVSVCSNCVYVWRTTPKRLSTLQFAMCSITCLPRRAFCYH